MLEEVKEYIKVTWEHEDRLIQGIITRGMGYFNGLTGVKLVFEEDEQAMALLLDYCRYGYNNSLEYFEDNFSKEILRLQIKEAVKDSKGVLPNEG